MKKVLYTLLKAFLYVLVEIVFMLSMSIIAMLVAGSVMSIVLGVLSFFRDLPEIVVSHYGLVLAVVSAPVALFMYLQNTIKVHRIRNSSKQKKTT